MAPTRTKRAPRKAPAPAEKVGRPSNAWILYRTQRALELKLDNPDAPPMKQSDLSRIVSAMWKQEPDHVRRHYEKEAEIKKREHEAAHPGYKYQPLTKQQKLAAREEAKAAKKLQQAEARAAKAAAKAAGRRKGSSQASSSRTVSLEVTPPVQAPVEVAPPVQAAVEVAAPRKASRRVSAKRAGKQRASAPSTYAGSAQLGMGESPPAVSDAESPSVPSSGSQALARLPYPLQAPVPDFPTPPNPLYSMPSFLPQASSTQPPVAGSDGRWPASTSTPDDSPPSYTEGDSFTASAMASALSHGFESLESALEWHGEAPVPFDDPHRAFPVHLPIAGQGDNPVDLDDMFKALQWTRTGTTWMMPPSLADIDIGAYDLASGPSTAPYFPNPSGDALAPALDMGELHDAMEDAEPAGIDPAAFNAAMDGSAPIDFEELMAFQAQFPDVAQSVMNPQEYYRDAAAEAAFDYPRLTLPHQPPPHAVDPVNDVVPLEFVEPQQILSTDLQWFNDANEEITSLLATLPASGPSASTHPLSGPPTPTQYGGFLAPSDAPTPSASTAPFAPAPTSTSATATPVFASTPVDHAPATRRYVPPGGAQLGSRRRVGGRFDPAMYQAMLAAQSPASGSGST